MSSLPWNVSPIRRMRGVTVLDSSLVQTLAIFRVKLKLDWGPCPPQTCLRYLCGFPTCSQGPGLG